MPPEYCGEAQPPPFVWQGVAATPPRVEIHADNAPPDRDMFRETSASNCNAVNAKAPPQRRVEARSGRNLGRGFMGSMGIIVAEMDF